MAIYQSKASTQGKTRRISWTGFEGAHCILIMRNVVSEYKKYTLKNEKILIKLVLSEWGANSNWLESWPSLPPTQTAFLYFFMTSIMYFFNFWLLITLTPILVTNLEHELTTTEIQCKGQENIYFKIFNIFGSTMPLNGYGILVDKIFILKLGIARFWICNLDLQGF